MSGGTYAADCGVKTAVVCGIPDGIGAHSMDIYYCERDLEITPGPLRNLVCPKHGVIEELEPRLPIDLSGTIVCGPDGCSHL